MEKTISELLLEAGYAHERTDRTSSSGEHLVWRVSDGETVGYMTAHRAVEFLETLRATSAAA